MEKNSKSNSDFLSKLQEYSKKGIISKKQREILRVFYQTYADSLKAHKISTAHAERIFLTYLELIKKNLAETFHFQPYHRHIRKPFDYFKFGLDFIRPLIDREISRIHGQEQIDEIANHIAQGHNVILLANHQIEADPQVICILLEDKYPKLSSEIIFVAGERVTTDPLAVPFSIGCNLLCIYSKRYIDRPAEEKLKKQNHNKRTMALMKDLLTEGGKIIYVAPSGGRDRRNDKGTVDVTPFDPASVEMFYLMAKKAKHPTYFYPLALATYDLLPPPETIQIELGEMRSAQRGGICVAVGNQIDMENFPGSEISNKHERRKARADYIWNLVNKDYKQCF